MKNNLVDIVMSKELIDLEKIKRAHIAIFPDKRKEDGSLYTETEFEEEFNNIENALGEYEQYKAIEKKLGTKEEIMKELEDKKEFEKKICISTEILSALCSCPKVFIKRGKKIFSCEVTELDIIRKQVSVHIGPELWPFMSRAESFMERIVLSFDQYGETWALTIKELL